MTRTPIGKRSARRSGESGQALIVAVLLMLVVAGVAGLFIVMVAVNLSRVARQSDAIRARQYAQAAVRYAHYNLVHSPQGASWRPSEASRRFGEGEWDLTVSYRPTRGEPRSEFIKIEAVARPGDNPLVPRRAVAYAPIGITDYGRWVTNPENTALTASLGVPLAVDLDPLDPTAPTYPYRTDIDGSVRVNGNLEWHSRARVALWTSDPEYYRNDSVAVAGAITHAQNADFPPTVAVSVNGGSDDFVEPSDAAGFRTLGGRYRDGLPVEGRWVRRLEPPDLMRSRYLNLTRNTGYWRLDLTPDPDLWYKTGYYVTPYPGEVGDGLYVDNFTTVGDYRPGRDYEELRNDLLDYWEELNYTPDGAKITLYPADKTGNPHGGHPYITITRSGHDGKFHQPNPDKEDDPLDDAETVEVLYPRNGVIFLEGNALVHGTLPPRAGNPGSEYYVDEDNRCYDLTIVSMGNIFIDENLLGPRSAGLTTDADEDTKLALLAGNSVVLLYVSRHGLRPVYTPYSLSQGCYEVQPGEPYEAWFSLTEDPRPGLRLLLSHAGAENPATTGPDGQTVMRLLINYDPSQPAPLNAPYDWTGTEGTTSGDPTEYYLFKPPPVWTANNESNAVAPVIEQLPDSGEGYDKTIILDDYLVKSDGTQGFEAGVLQRIRIETPYDTARNYWLYKIALPTVNIEVDALIYAQKGSWYVLPGPWYNEISPPPDPENPFIPGYQEPLDVRVTIRGAIAEGRTAPLSDVKDWVEHWRGSDETWDEASGTSDRALNYVYDPSLRAALDPEDRNSSPRLQGLPVSPVLLHYGEHM